MESKKKKKQKNFIEKNSPTSKVIKIQYLDVLCEMN